MTPRMRVFAGPNGSGKSTIKALLKPDWLGVYLNADDIEKELKQSGIHGIPPFDIVPTTADLQKHLSASTQVARSDLEPHDIARITISQGQIMTNGVAISSYLAAGIVDFFRECLVQQRMSFSFETVMSNKGKVRALERAQAAGFRTYLYFVATSDPGINVDRVRIRVSQGGHPVQENLIRERYSRSLDLLNDAVRASSRAYVFDNSGSESVLLAEIEDGSRLTCKTSPVPQWVQNALLVHFQQ